MMLSINVLQYNILILCFRRELPFFAKSTGTIHLVLVGLTAGWVAGWLADEMWVEVEFFEICYRLNYLDFYYV